MRKRPLSVTVIGWLFVAVGIVAVAYHASEFDAQRPFDYELIWICFVRLLALLSGVFILRGRNWARWLLVAWLAFHVILSAFHSAFELVVHFLLATVVAYFLFRVSATAYFRRARDSSANR